MNEKEYKEWAAANPGKQRPDVDVPAVLPPVRRLGFIRRTVWRARLYTAMPFMILAIYTLRTFKPKLGSKMEKLALFFRRTAYRIGGKKCPPIIIQRFHFQCLTCNTTYVCGGDFMTDWGIVCNKCGKVQPKFKVETITLE